MSLLQRIRTPFAQAPPEGDAWPAPRAPAVGELLRDRREELGLDLDSIGAALRIKPAYLAALEQGRTEDLPGPTYAIGFVRAYADHLGLDGEQALARFKAQSADLPTRPDLAFPMPLPERSLPGGTMLVVALILALCGYGTWYYLSTAGRSRPEPVAEVPQALQPPPATIARAPGSTPEAPVSGMAATPGTAPAGAAAQNPIGQNPIGQNPIGQNPVPQGPAGENPAAGSVAAGGPAIENPARQGTAADNTAAPENSAASPSLVAPPAPGTVTAATPAAATASPQILIHATADSWIQIRNAHRAIVFSRILRAGETYEVPQDSGLTMRTGNAGGLAISVGGKPVPPLGRSGALRRNVALDPAALLGGAAAHG